MPVPEIAVVVPSHDRPVRLRWLLNALQEQTLPPERWEVIVAHDSLDRETDDLLSRHPLARQVRLVGMRLSRGTKPAVKRNAGWRASVAPLIIITHDDCRPVSTWLESAVAASRASAGAVIAGPVRPDPDEIGLLELAGFARTKTVEPLASWADGCNVLYPRALLEALGGFDESLAVADDAVMRSRALGARVGLVPADEMLTHHAVVVVSFAARLHRAWSLRELARAVAVEPSLRRHLVLRAFYDQRHAMLVLGLVGLALSRRNRGTLLAALPWVARTWCPRSRTWRGLLRSASELPSEVITQIVEVVALGVTSVTERTFVL